MHKVSCHETLKTYKAANCYFPIFYWWHLKSFYKEALHECVNAEIAWAKTSNSPKVKACDKHLLDDEVTVLILAEFDLKTRFDIYAQRWQDKAKRGLELLEKANKLT